MLLEKLRNGRYQRLHSLGSSPTGEVYLMEDTRFHRQVAIKVMRTEAARPLNGDTSHIFQREAQTVTALEHPHILPLYDYGEERLDGSIITYVVMPFCSEGTLKDWLHQRGSARPLSPMDIAFLLDQAADALQYAHDHHVIHQAIKPANFFIRSNKKNLNHPTLLLADFGISKFIASAPANPSPHDNLLYMAPEQWSQHPVPASDQYALAIMAYELLLGQPPFRGTPEQLRYQHSQIKPVAPGQFNRRFSGALEATLLRAMAKKPEERFPSVSAFAKAFEQAAAALSSPPSAQYTTSDLQATLAISNTEARTGTNRMITLPGGRQLGVSVPSGAYDGQVLRLQGLDWPNGMLNLTLTVLHPEETDPQRSTNAGNAELTILTSGSGSQTPPPPYQQSSSPPIAPPPYVSGPITPSFVSMTPVKPLARPTRLNRKTLLLVALALVVILSATSLFFVTLANRNQGNVPNSKATQTINAANTATTLATTAPAHATATASARATATVVATNPNPYPPGKGTLALYDPMSDNTHGYGWDDNPAKNCYFASDGYHIKAPSNNLFVYCVANATDFSNFAFDVQMKIAQGNNGGVIFRASGDQSKYYLFSISETGIYYLSTYVDTLSAHARRIITSFSLAVNRNLNQTNTVGVVANGTTITLYVNHQQIYSFTDKTYSHGQIGFIASPSSQVIYTKTRVWSL